MDKTNTLIKELIESGYMVKMKKSITFAKSGEMKNIFYFSDNREVLMGAFKNTAPDFPPMEKTTDTNKELYKKDIIQKEDTKLTIFSNLEETLDNLLDSGTKRNLLKLKPNITLEEFNELYKNVSEQYKLGFTTNLNACLILAASGKWKFRSKTISKTKSKDVINPEKILAGKVDYFYSYYIETNCNPEEILLKFQNDSKKYDSSLVQNFYKLLDVKLKMKDHSN
ncbi:MAG: hypothetical protein ACRC4S_00240 [Cetobacterium sp.]